jgi:hypothetical protein
MCREFGVRLEPCSLSTPGQARAFAVQGLTEALDHAPGVEPLTEATTVVLSELVTNAVQAGCSALTVNLDLHRSHLRLLVDDDAPGWPTPAVADIDDVRGRGLAIVAGLTRSWGVQVAPNGKRVWAELPVPHGVAADLQCRY